MTTDVSGGPGLFRRQVKKVAIWEEALRGGVCKTFVSMEWILFIGAHSDRHTKQILEVEANPGFPKK